MIFIVPDHHYTVLIDHDRTAIGEPSVNVLNAGGAPMMFLLLSRNDSVLIQIFARRSLRFRPPKH